jgi:hypothetical protein
MGVAGPQRRRRGAEGAERRAVRESAAAQRVPGGQGRGSPAPAAEAARAKDAKDARLDAQELLALVAELYAELAKLRKEVSTLRATRSM